MSDQIIITLPEDISQTARAIAETTNQSAEQVVLNYLKMLSAPLPTLPPDEQKELDALRHLSDDTLWTIARDQMPDAVQLRAQALMMRNNRETLTEAEQDELDQLVQRADRLMLRKAEAATILRERGHAFTQQDFLPQDE